MERREDENRGRRQAHSPLHGGKGICTGILGSPFVIRILINQTKGTNLYVTLRDRTPPRILKRKDCTRVHYDYDYDDRTPGMNLSVT